MIISTQSPIRLLTLILVFAACAPADTLRITELVTDPQSDHNESSGGNGTPFDSTPGTGSITSSDEFIELRNFSNSLLDLTGYGLDFNDSTVSVYTFGVSTVGTLRFSPGSSLTALEPGAFVLLGNPPGALNNTIGVLLKDANGTALDQWDLVGGVTGNATGLADEAVIRAPNGESYQHTAITPLAESPLSDWGPSPSDPSAPESDPTPTPEPGTIWLLALTGAGVVAAKRRRARRAAPHTPSRTHGRCGCLPAGRAASPEPPGPRCARRENA